MANVQKYTRSACGHLFAHFERARDENGEYIKFGNKSIDKTRTDLNYNLAPDRSQIDYLQERLSQVRCLKRDDVKVMCSWVLTAPQSVMYYERDLFFKSAYDFFVKRYGGEQNVISSYVHCDESTDHMHFAFIPIVYDKKKDCYKVSAKEVLTKRELQTIHTDLSNYLQEVFGRDVGVLLDDSTKRDNKEYKPLAELKRETAIAELEAIESRVATLNEVREVNANITVKKPLWAKNERVEMSKSDYDILYRQAESSAKGDLLLDELKKEVEQREYRLQSSVDLGKEIVQLKRSIKKLEQEKRLLERDVERLGFFERFVMFFPDLVKRFFAWIEEQSIDAEIFKCKEELQEIKDYMHNR